MKKISLFVIILILILTGGFAQNQDEIISEKTDLSDEEPADQDLKYNYIDINPMMLPMGMFSIVYSRAIHEQLLIAVVPG